MKKFILSSAAIFICALSFACTNLVVGKKASADGSVICTYNCDSFGFASPLYYSPAGRHEPGEMIAIRGWAPDSPVRYIPQVEYTYAVVGLMNDHQVSIMETTWGGREELVNSEGYFNYDNLMRVTLQRAASAREAIRIMDELVREYGYSDSGESFAICDKDEAWIMEIVGIGKGRKGAAWVALRLPDDCITAYANVSRIRKFPTTGKMDKKLGFYIPNQDCMYSAECISYAREAGYFSGKDEDFSYREAYSPIDFSKVRYCDARVWSFFRHHYDKDEMDAYIPYLNGQFDVCDELPLWIKPDAPVSVRDIMNDMRDHYEGTVFDMTADVSAGPWASPYRSRDINFKSSDGTDMFRERPIGCQQSGMTMVCQMRNWLPDEFGGVTYFNMDDATMVAYVPVFSCLNRVPEPFLQENNKIDEFNPEGAFWMNNFVANMIYPRWSAMIGELRTVQTDLEDFYEKDMKAIEQELASMSKDELVSLLNKKTETYTEMMMSRWDKLARLLIVKYNDQAVLRSPVPGEQQPTPQYSPVFIDAVKAQTGNRYVRP